MACTDSVQTILSRHETWTVVGLTKTIFRFNMLEGFETLVHRKLET